MSGPPWLSFVFAPHPVVVGPPVALPLPPTPPPAVHQGEIWIEDVNLWGNVLSINGPSVPYEFLVRNVSDADAHEVALQGSIEQGRSWFGGGGVLVGSGTVDAQGTRSGGFGLGASDAWPTVGHGRLVPGPALARFELKVDWQVVDTVVIPVTLVP